MARTHVPRWTGTTTDVAALARDVAALGGSEQGQFFRPKLFVHRGATVTSFDGPDELERELSATDLRSVDRIYLDAGARAEPAITVVLSAFDGATLTTTGDDPVRVRAVHPRLARRLEQGRRAWSNHSRALQAALVVMSCIQLAAVALWFSGNENLLLAVVVGALLVPNALNILFLPPRAVLIPELELRAVGRPTRWQRWRLRAGSVVGVLTLAAATAAIQQALG